MQSILKVSHSKSAIWYFATRLRFRRELAERLGMKKLSVALAAIFLSSVSNGAEPAKATPSSGRFQLVQLSSMRSDQYLLDTQTGKMWSREC